MGRRPQAETPVTDTVSLFEPSTLELGLWAVQWLLAVMLATFGAGETIRLGKNFIDVFRVIGPVSRYI